MRFPPPGRMVDIGGRLLHVQVSGERFGGPTVLLEAGLAATSLSWALVQPLIAEFARVASYDRAGLGWSGDAVAPATALNAVHDLRAVIERAELPGPYILVGHSFGGLIVRLFQQLHPDRVAGLVLVDPVARAEWREPDARHGKMLERGAALSRRGAFLAKIGVVRFVLERLTGGSQRMPEFMAKIFAGHGSGVVSRMVGEVRKIPRELWPLIAAHWSEARAFQIMAEYLALLPVSCGQLDAGRTLGDLPVIVLSSASATAGNLAEHQADACLSTRGEHRVVPGTGHWINLDAPEAIAAALRTSPLRL